MNFLKIFSNEKVKCTFSQNKSPMKLNWIQGNITQKKLFLKFQEKIEGMAHIKHTKIIFSVYEPN